MSVYVSSCILIVVVFFTILAYSLCGNKNFRKRTKYPPGPELSLPILGNLLQLGVKPHVAFKKWRKKYGPIFGFKMGTKNAVVVSDPKLLKQFFSRTPTAGKLHSPVLNLIVKENVGIVSSEGKSWEEQRRYALRTLKDLGMTKGGVIEDILQYEANKFLVFLRKRVGRPLQGKRLFNGLVFNSLWTVISGQRIELESPHVAPEEGIYVKLASDVVDAFCNPVSTALFMAPWLRHVFPQWSGWTNLLKASTALEKVAYETVNQAKLLESPHTASNFIEKYIYQIQSTKQQSSCFYQEKGRENLVATMAELFLAGSQTTATSLEYILLYLTQFPQVQTNVQIEIDREIGSSGLPCLNDKPKLPYTEAVIMETMRRSTLFPFGAPHKALEDFEFHGYCIPKGTILFADLYNIHRDETLWYPDPDEFRPERHLNEDKTKIVRNNALVPFSIGKRQCMGETLANDSLFLIIACLMQTFTVKCYDGKVNMDDVISGPLLLPRPFRVVFSLRKK